MMRDTVYVLSEAASEVEVEASINEMAAAVQAYVPGYRLKQRVQFEVIPQDKPVNLPGIGQFSGLKTRCIWKWKARRTICPPMRATSTL